MTVQFDRNRYDIADWMINTIGGEIVEVTDQKIVAASWEMELTAVDIDGYGWRNVWSVEFKHLEDEVLFKLRWQDAEKD